MIYILLPVYNEENNLRNLLQKIKIGCARLDDEYEIIVYNDGSTDSSMTILDEIIANEDYPLKVLAGVINLGLGIGILSLLKEVCRCSVSDSDVAIVLDADNSHNPELIGEMIVKIRHGFDMVIASRYLPDSRVVGVSIFRQFLSLGASWLMRLLYPIKGVKDYTCGYRAYTISLLRRAFEKYGDDLIEESSFACMAELLIKLRYLRILVVECPLLLRYDFKQGESKMNIVQSVHRTLLLLAKLKIHKKFKL
jgi:dolichol-phosphate mannosyltransferase